jgi:hypothetical protein
LSNCKYLFNAVAFKPILGLTTIRVKYIAVRFSMGSIITDHRIPFILEKCFQLNAKFGDLLAFGYMVMSVTALASFRVKVDEKFAFCHGWDYTSASFFHSKRRFRLIKTKRAGSEFQALLVS